MTESGFRPTGTPDLAVAKSHNDFAMLEPREQLATLLKEHVVGRPFSELAAVTFDHRAATVMGHVLIDALEDAGYSIDDFDAVGALTAASVPMVSAMIQAAASRGEDLDGFVIEQLVLARLDPDLLFDDPFTPTQKLKDSYKRVGNGVRNLVDAIKKEDLGSHRPTLYHSTLSKRLRKSLDGRAPEIEPGAVKELWEAYINSLMQDLRLLQAITHAVQRQSAARSIRENRSIALAVAEHIFYRIVSYHQYDLKKQSFAAPTKKVLRDLTYDIWCLYMPAHRNEISSDQVDKIGRKKTR